MLISCTLTTETPADFSQFISCRKGQQQVNVVQDWRPLVEKYFKPQDVDKAMRIIFCESSGSLMLLVKIQTELGTLVFGNLMTKLGAG